MARNKTRYFSKTFYDTFVDGRLCTDAAGDIGPWLDDVVESFGDRLVSFLVLNLVPKASHQLTIIVEVTHREEHTS